MVQTLVQMACPAHTLRPRRRRGEWRGGDIRIPPQSFSSKLFAASRNLEASRSPAVISRICPLLELLTITPVTLIMSQPFNITSRDTNIFQFIS